MNDLRDTQSGQHEQRGQHDEQAAHGRQPNYADILAVVAERMRRRATRRANTIPMLATMGTSALAIELRMRAEDHEAIAAAAGVQYVSRLRKIADALPTAAREGVAFLLRIDTMFVDALDKAVKSTKASDIDRDEEANEVK
jgi:hypothetical protein